MPNREGLSCHGTHSLSSKPHDPLNYMYTLPSINCLWASVCSTNDHKEIRLCYSRNCNILKIVAQLSKSSCLEFVSKQRISWHIAVFLLHQWTSTHCSPDLEGSFLLDSILGFLSWWMWSKGECDQQQEKGQWRTCRHISN